MLRTSDPGFWVRRARAAKPFGLVAIKTLAAVLTCLWPTQLGT